MKKLAAAIAFATKMHDGQFDRGNKPYILHCLKVMHYTKSENEDVLCAAVLHDVVEDTSATFKDLTTIGMTSSVIKAVRALTKLPGQNYEEEYKIAVKSDAIARIVKMADLRHNSDLRRLKGVTEKDLARVAKYMKFYQELKEFELVHKA